jgi:hypothetical protein
LIWNVPWKAARDGEVEKRALPEPAFVLEGEVAVEAAGSLLLFSGDVLEAAADGVPCLGASPALD